MDSHVPVGYTTHSMLRTRRRVLALFLLVWAVADLSVPGFCRTDGALSAGQTAMMASAASPGDSNPLKTGDYEEDCFCCCTHIIPSLHFELAAGLVFTPELVYTPQTKPMEFHGSVYHPPRS